MKLLAAGRIENYNPIEWESVFTPQCHPHKPPDVLKAPTDALVLSAAFVIFSFCWLVALFPDAERFAAVFASLGVISGAVGLKSARSLGRRTFLFWVTILAGLAVIFLALSFRFRFL